MIGGSPRLNLTSRKRRSLWEQEGEKRSSMQQAKVYLRTSLRFYLAHTRHLPKHFTALSGQVLQNESQLPAQCLKNKQSTSSKSLLIGRFFSSKDVLKSERAHWEKASIKYADLAAKFRQKLNGIYEKYSFSLGTSEIALGDSIYFEEDGCIFRLRSKDVLGQENAELLLCPERLCFPDATVQRIRISPNQKYLAASFRSSACEESTCVVVKLEELPDVKHIIPDVFSFEWATADVLFYTCQKNLGCRHVFLSDFSKERYTKLVYAEQDPRFFVDIYCTKDKRFLTINCNSKSTSEVWLVDCNCPISPPILVQQRTPGVLYHVEHRNEKLYILTTWGETTEYKLMKAPVGSCGKENWQLVYSVKEKAKLVDLEMMGDHCALFLKYRNHLYFDVLSLTTESVSQSFKITSPVQPPADCVYSLTDGSLCINVEQDVPNTLKCVTLRLQAKNKDGTFVPITVFHKACCKDLHRKPLLVHVYGAYGIDMNMSFKAENLLLIEDDWILAYCHVRGGGELGHSWHEDGRLDKKLNGVEDLKACVRHLHELGYSGPSYTVLAAASAGGVLAGALCNSSPELIKAVVLKAPFLDVLNTMLDTLLPLTIEEQEEWGNPLSDEKYAEYIKRYCPYQNIKSQNYPSVIITAYENDQRVPLMGLLSYIHRLRKAVTDYSSNLIKEGYQIPNLIFDVRPGGSHCDPDSWEDSLNEVARHFAFLYKELGLAKQEPPR
ncbi:prolyl endopeptidase-like isoform X2 [Rhinatrema bivittatum]|uniref:prolyl endopeptidase-like isoform X2 n=1 Tax=Rhinatrema bivittatum TaxID=194408 RepID=UPI00112CBAA1|nr:prolyl endopeptidase-like isoform X2 [Rhinatrema bivittatum]